MIMTFVPPMFKTSDMIPLKNIYVVLSSWICSQFSKKTRLKPFQAMFQLSKYVVPSHSAIKIS